MKKLGMIGIITILFGSAVFGRSIYGGVNAITVVSEDFVNFHISDWQDYGLKLTNPYSAEGRVAIPLGEYDPAGGNPGVFLGISVPVNSQMDALLEVQATIGDFLYGGIYVGANYKFINTSFLKVGLTPKIGYNVGMAIGEIELINGYTPPVILDEGTFTNGDSLTMELSGIGLQIALTPEIQLGGLSVFAQAGYQLSFVSNAIIKVNDDLEIPMESLGVVKDNYSAAQAGLSPVAAAGGLFIQLGVSFNLEQ